MTTKQYLEQWSKLNMLIENQKEVLEQLKMKSTSISAVNYSRDIVQGGSRERDAGFVNIIDKIITLEKKIECDYIMEQKLLVDIYESIDAIPNIKEKLVLQCKYILLMTLEQTAERMSYSVTQINRIHAAALKNFVVPIS